MRQTDPHTDVKFTSKGLRNRRELRLVMMGCGISIESRYPTLKISELPLRPVLDASEISIPAKTLESLAAIADFASTDATHYVINGVRCGRMMATGSSPPGRRLASAPADILRPFRSDHERPLKGGDLPEPYGKSSPRRANRQPPPYIAS